VRDVQSVQDLARAMTDAKRDLEQAQTDLETLAREAPEKEREYRLARAKTFARSMKDTVKAREFEADEKCADEKYEATLSENLRQAALERVRSCRAIFSGVQTLTNAWREEVAFARGGGEFDSNPPGRPGR